MCANETRNTDVTVCYIYSHTFAANSMAGIWQIMEGLSATRLQKKQTMKETLARISELSLFLRIALCKCKYTSNLYN